MAIELPPSLDPRRHPLDEEVAPARAMTPEERLVVVASVCRAAMLVLRMHPKRERVLAMRDPVPESTRAALRRLRASR